MERMKMLEWVQALCFVVVDMELYLDTHPCDEEALAFYRDSVENYEKAKRKFEEMYGPLTAVKSMDCERWRRWICGYLSYVFQYNRDGLLEGICEEQRVFRTRFLFLHEPRKL